VRALGFLFCRRSFLSDKRPDRREEEEEEASSWSTIGKRLKNARSLLSIEWIGIYTIYRYNYVAIRTDGDEM
jgi:hypothetical protein